MAEAEEPAAEEPAAEAEEPAAEEPAAEAEAAPAAAKPAAAKPARKRTVKAKAGEPQEDEGPSARAPRGAKPKKAPAAPKKAKTKAERGTYVRTPATEQGQGQRRERRGVVTSDKGDKTITVRVDVMKPHPKYHKIMRRSVKLHAHDEANSAHVGDVVRVVEMPPAVAHQALAPRRDRRGGPVIQAETRLRVADNTGAREILCIRVRGGSRRRYARVGDIIVATVKQATPNGSRQEGRGRAGGHRAHEEGVSCATTARTSRSTTTPRSSSTPAGNPRGTRIFGPVARELRERNYMKIVSLAPEVL